MRGAQLSSSKLEPVILTCICCGSNALYVHTHTHRHDTHRESPVCLAEGAATLTIKASVCIRAAKDDAVSALS